MGNQGKKFIFDLMRKIIIAVDGYSACGKSTTAKRVAAKLGYLYIDSGAMYRATTLYFLEHYVDLYNPHSISKALDNISIKFLYNEHENRNETYLNGLNVEKEVRSMRVTEKVSEVSAIPEVRHKLVTLQKEMGKKRGVVMDGRDIGTKVFPDAELKLFMTADIYKRAHRRQQELLAQDQLVDLDQIVENLKKRDHIDTTREEGPLKKAEDAVEVDTTFLLIEEQVDIVLRLASSVILKKTADELVVK